MLQMLKSKKRSLNEMTAIKTEYFKELCAAFVRGSLNEPQKSKLPSELILRSISELSEAQLDELIKAGIEADLKIHKFKKTMGLARVKSILGIMEGLNPDEVLDIGSGRGAFLWPLLNRFPQLPVCSLDCNPIRVRDINAVRNGGIGRLNAVEADICKADLPENSFDLVTMLEVLEHIGDAQTALNKAVSIARRFLLLSVPLHEDDNEEHIHLFNKENLGKMLAAAGAARTKFQYVHNHMIAIVSV